MLVRKTQLQMHPDAELVVWHGWPGVRTLSGTKSHHRGSGAGPVGAHAVVRRGAFPSERDACVHACAQVRARKHKALERIRAFRNTRRLQHINRAPYYPAPARVGTQRKRAHLE